MDDENWVLECNDFDRIRTIEDEIGGTGRSWNEVKGIAGDRNAWKLFVDALCSTRSKRT
jgi:hypothetical protein